MSGKAPMTARIKLAFPSILVVSQVRNLIVWTRVCPQMLKIIDKRGILYLRTHKFSYLAPAMTPVGIWLAMH